MIFLKLQNYCVSILTTRGNVLYNTGKSEVGWYHIVKVVFIDVEYVILQNAAFHGLKEIRSND